LLFIPTAIIIRGQYHYVCYLKPKKNKCRFFAFFEQSLIRIEKTKLINLLYQKNGNFILCFDK